jgi:hypothetical protein
MKYAKMLGLLAVAAAALMAFAATASATTLTSPSGTTYTGEVHAESEGITTLHGAATIECEVSTVSGKVEAHGEGITASGKISTLTFEKCNHHVTVLKKGELIVHTDKETVDGNGTLTSNGAEITIQITGLVSCIFTTSNTDIGTLTGSDTKHATLDIDSVAIPRTGHSIFCGSSGEWTGSYTVTKPSTLTVD